MKDHWKYVLLFISVFTCYVSRGESAYTRQLWLDFNPSYQLNNQWELHGDLGFRTIDPNIWNRYVIRPALRYVPENVFFKKKDRKESLVAGLGFFYTENFHFDDIFEFRIFQGYQFKWPQKTYWQLTHYARLEERFNFDVNGSAYDFGMRFRYLLNFTFTPLKNPVADKDGMYFPFSVEPFFNLDRTTIFNDHLRVIPGIGYWFKDGWRTEFRLAWHLSGYGFNEQITTNNLVARLRVYYIIP